MIIKFSRLTCVRSLAEDWEVICDCGVCPQDGAQFKRRKKAVTPARHVPGLRTRRFPPIAHTPVEHMHATLQQRARD